MRILPPARRSQPGRHPRPRRQHGPRGTPARTREGGGVDRAYPRRLGAYEPEHLAGQVKPRRLPAINVVQDAGGHRACAELDQRCRKIRDPRRAADLVGDDVERLALAFQTQHGVHEVGARPP
jgi:hypothetical protein